MTFTETVVVGLCTAFATAVLSWGGHLLVAYLQRGNEQTKFFREKLLDRYSEFVAIASAELDRTKSIDAAMAFGGRDHDYTEAHALDQLRHTRRQELLRLSLQIRLLEQDQSLANRVEQLAKSQPFMGWPFPPRWGEGTYTERAERYKAEIGTFEKQLHELIAAVVEKHAVRGHGRPPSPPGTSATQNTGQPNSASA